MIFEDFPLNLNSTKFSLIHQSSVMNFFKTAKFSWLNGLRFWGKISADFLLNWFFLTALIHSRAVKNSKFKKIQLWISGSPFIQIHSMIFLKLKTNSMLFFFKILYFWELSEKCLKCPQNNIFYLNFQQNTSKCT